ncbi:MAG: M28 family peptidase [Candidatus Korarchaeum sp.]
MNKSMLPVLLILLLVIPPVQALPSATEELSLAEKVDISYAKYIVEKLTSIGSYKEPKFLGFRVAGTEQDLESAKFIVEEMRKMGLANVSLEPVPVDAWEFRGARLELENGKVYLASSYGGSPGTGERGIEGELVYVAGGLRENYEGVNVSGKLVLAYWNPDDGWLNMIAHEATVRGAKGVILFNPPNGSYAQHPNALHSFDGLYSSDFVPIIVISKEDAQEILNMLEKGPVRARMVSLAEVRKGTGWNTIGYVPGRRADEYILIAAHHDAWFYGAMDDTAAVAAVLTLAKAVKESGYVPERTLVFMTHTAEEYGVVDSYYDWLIGAWWRITEAHPEWQSKAVIYLNVEGMAHKGVRLGVDVVPELSSFLSEVLEDSRDLLPYGWEDPFGEIYSWTEAWPYTAAGVPSVNTDTFSDWFRRGMYHTQFDAIELLDWDYLSNIIKVCSKILVRFDRSQILPYDFTARAEHMKERLNATLMRELGVNPDDLLSRLEEFSRAASEFNELRKREFPDGLAIEVNERVREAARILLSGLTALDPWDGTIYPHQQVESDTVCLKSALEALKQGDAETALSMMEGVSINWYAPRYSYEVFKRELAHKSPGWPKVTWGGLGHLAPLYDLWKEYNSISEKLAKNLTDYSEEARVVGMYYAVSLYEYQRRVREMANVIEKATIKIKEANSLMKAAEVTTETKSVTAPKPVGIESIALIIAVVVVLLLIGLVFYRRKAG